MAQLWVLGLCINIFGNIVISLGTNLIKMFHIKNEKLKINHTVGQSCYAISGFFCMTFGSIINFASFSLAAQSLLASMGSIQFLTNLIFGFFLLHINITYLVIIGILFVCAGNVIVVIFASHESMNYTSSQLIDLYNRPLYIVYITILFVILVISGIINYFLNKIPLHNQHLFHIRAIAITFAIISAIPGTQSVTLAKSAAQLIRETIWGENQFNSSTIYFIILFWLIFMTYWILRLNLALKTFDALFIMPCFQVTWVFFSLIGGGVYFDEFKDFSALNKGMIALGVFIIVGGIMWLANISIQSNILLKSNNINQDDLSIRSESNYSILSPKSGSLLINDQKHSYKQSDQSSQINNNDINMKMFNDNIDSQLSLDFTESTNQLYQKEKDILVDNESNDLKKETNQDNYSLYNNIVSIICMDINFFQCSCSNNQCLNFSRKVKNQI